MWSVGTSSSSEEDDHNLEMLRGIDMGNIQLDTGMMVLVEDCIRSIGRDRAREAVRGAVDSASRYSSRAHAEEAFMDALEAACRDGVPTTPRHSVPDSARKAAAAILPTHVTPPTPVLDQPVALDTIAVHQTAFPWLKEDPCTTEFLKRYEVSRHFKPLGALDPEPELLHRLQSTEARHVTRVVQDYFGTNLSTATTKVWKYLVSAERSALRDVVYTVVLRRAGRTADEADHGHGLHIQVKPPSVSNLSHVCQVFGSDRFLRVRFDAELFDDRHVLPTKLVLFHRTYEFLCPWDSYCYYFATHSEVPGDLSDVSCASVLDSLVPLSASQDLTPAEYAAKTREGLVEALGVLPWASTVYASMAPGPQPCAAPMGRKRVYQVRDHLKLPMHIVPSVVLGRVGGVSRLWYLDLTVDDRTVFVPGPVDQCAEFEVIGYARSSGPGTLSHNLVLILETLGVPVAVFEELQSEMVRRFAAVTFNEDPFVTGAFVDGYLRHAYSTRDRKALLTSTLSMVLSGFDQRDAHLQALALDLYREGCTGFREKSNIEIHKSRCVHYLVDYAGVLADGQCYVQLKGMREDGSPLGALQGPVALARVSANLPSDFLVLEAVDVFALSHLTEVVVLPAASMARLSRTSLEKVFVTWEPRIVEPLVVQEPSVSPVPLDDIFQSDPGAARSLAEVPAAGLMEELFQVYLQHESVSRLVNTWHQALGDAYGASDPRCVELAHVCRTMREHEAALPTLEYLTAMSTRVPELGLPAWMPQGPRESRVPPATPLNVYDAEDELVFNDTLDPELEAAYSAIPEDRRGVMEDDIAFLVAEYDTALEQARAASDPLCDVHARFRARLLEGVDDLEEAKQWALCAYKLCHPGQGFAYDVAGDLLGAVKALGIEGREGTCKTVDGVLPLHPVVIPRSVLHRFAVDRKALNMNYHAFA